MMQRACRIGEICKITERSYAPIEDFARNLFVWRKPFPKIYQSEVTNGVLMRIFPGLSMQHDFGLLINA
jgi:hypothetical protein